MDPWASPTANCSPVGHSTVAGPGMQESTSSTVAFIFKGGLWRKGLTPVVIGHVITPLPGGLYEVGAGHAIQSLYAHVGHPQRTDPV